MRLTSLVQALGLGAPGAAGDGVVRWMTRGGPVAECQGDPMTAVRDDSLRALTELSPGDQGRVVRVVAGVPSIGRRLMDLGFSPGALVEVVRRAPLGDPVVYRVKDYEVCLRRAQAACVYVAGAGL